MRFQKWAQVEEKYGKPMRDVLISLYEKHGNNERVHQLVAGELGVTVKGLRDWRNATECQVVTRLMCNPTPTAQSKE